MRLTRVVPLFCLLVLTAPAIAQLPLRAEWLGPQSSPITAEVMDVLGDVNGDGVVDYIVGKGTDYVDFGSGITVGTGRTAVISGADGSILVPHWGPQLNCHYGATVAAMGDLNGDGIADFAAAAPDFSLGGSAAKLGLVAFVSGANGAVIDFVFGSNPQSFAGGVMVAAGDVNGDGIVDIAYAENQSGANAAPTIRIRSGATRNIIRSIIPSVPVADWTQGIVLCRAGDADNDGVEDLAVGIPGATPVPFSPSIGIVHVYSGATGSILCGSLGTVVSGSYGAALVGVGDVNGDGHDDIAAGAPGAAHIKIFSGSDGSTLHTIGGGTGFGRSLAYGSDLNGDGFKDIAVASNDVEQIVILSGQDRSQLRGLKTWRTGQVIGNSMLMVADVNNDGFDELVTTSEGDLNQILQGLPVSGIAQMAIAGSREYGAPGGVQALHLHWVDIPLADPAFGGFVCEGASPFANGMVGVSLAPDDSLIQGLPLYLAVDSVNLIHNLAFGFSSFGELIYPLALRNPVVAGTTFHVQVFQTSPPFGASNRLELLYTR